MKTALTYNLKGTAGDKLNLPKALFESDTNMKLAAQAVRVYLANQRKAVAKTKTRSEVNKTTAKMYRQKGTGRARHGAASAPIFVGGGVAFGPTGEQNHAMKLSASQKRAALLSALSNKAEEKRVVVVEGMDKATGKTSEMAKLMKTVKLEEGTKLVVAGQKQNKMVQAFKNLRNVKIAYAKQVSAYDVIAASWLILSAEALAEAEDHYVN